MILRDLGLREIAFISPLTKLKVFYAQRNEIETLENILSKVLKDLRLSHNNIKSIKDIGRLEKLLLDDNELTFLEGIQNLKVLNHACFSENQIIDFTPLSSLSKLETVILSGNPITDFLY